MGSLFKRKQAAPAAPDTSSAIYQQQQVETNKNAARDRVNRIFGIGDAPTMDARMSMYRGAAGAARDLNMKYLNEDKALADSDLHARLAAQGLGGGSVDVEKNADMNREYNNQVVDIGNKTDDMVRQLTAADEQKRLDLLDMISSGMDENSAVNNAYTQINNSMSNAVNNSRGRFVGNTLSNIAQMFGGAAYGAGANSARGSVPMPAGGYAPTAMPRNRSVRW
jgi:hypothetical protein